MTPPAAASRLLARALRHDPAGPAILGDLHEEFVRIHQARGPGSARRWYWREAILFSLGRWVRRNPASPREGQETAGSPLFRGLGQDAVQAFRAARRAPLP